MTDIEARKAMDEHLLVRAGKIGTDEHDTGYIHEITGGMATVGWRSGVVTPCPIADLSAA